MIYEISIIIPTNKLDIHLSVCLSSLKKHSKLDNIEIIVVLDGTTNYSEFFSSFVGMPLSIFELKKNHGPAYARNYGAKRANGEILFFLDADTSIHHNTLLKVKEQFFSFNSDAIVGSYDDSPENKRIVSRFRNLLHYYVHQNSTYYISTFWGACGAIRKKLFIDIGGFDTSFKKPSIEDIELGYRLTKAGVTIELKKDLFIKHLKHWSLINMIKTDVLLRAKPWSKELLKSGKLSERNLNVNIHDKIAVLLVWIGLFSLGFGIINSWVLLFSIIIFFSLFFLKLKLYTFFSKHFTLLRMPIIILLHWCYLLSASIGFILGIIEYKFAS